jgi:uncharacterized protein (DUF1499 family)
VSPRIGVVDGRLQPCPGSPNCVCSQPSDASHHVAPLPLDGDPTGAIPKLRQLVASMPRTRIVTTTAAYLHAEFRSWLLGFVDDVEFLVDADAGVVHVRSASRTGYSDLGVNRRRVETIRRSMK